MGLHRILEGACATHRPECGVSACPTFSTSVASCWSFGVGRSGHASLMPSGNWLLPDRSTGPLARRLASLIACNRNIRQPRSKPTTKLGVEHHHRHSPVSAGATNSMFTLTVKPMRHSGRQLICGTAVLIIERVVYHVVAGAVDALLPSQR